MRVFEHACRTPSVSFMVIHLTSSLEHSAYAAYAAEVVLKEEYRFRTLRHAACVSKPTCQSVDLGFQRCFDNVWSCLV